MKTDNSEATARRILDHYLASIRTHFADRVDAVILTGSLVTGSHVPGPGDIDQITIVRDACGPETAAQLLRSIEEAMGAFGRAVNMAVVIYQRRDLQRPWRTEWDFQPVTKHLVCVPEELLRIHDHGIVVYGPAYLLQTLPTPSRSEMIQYHLRWRDWNRRCGFLAGRPDLPLRLRVQIILSNAIWDYYYATGRTCFNKHAIATRLAADVPDYRFQSHVEQATRIRMEGFPDVAPETIEHISQGCQDLLDWGETHSPDCVPLFG